MVTAPQQIWETSLGHLQLLVPRASYDTWLKGTLGMSLERDCLTVAVPTTFAAEWLERRMYQLIQRAVTEVAGRKLQLRFQVLSSHRDLINGTTRHGADGGTSLSPLLIRDEPSPGAAQHPQPSLNPRYTFDSFVIGNGNQLAYAAAAAVADRPGEQYNPLFLYSGAGLGKTHLLHAIASRVSLSRRTPLYATTEQFTNEFISAIRERKTEEFRARYRSVDVLLLDDIQFLAGKEQTQEGFFHTFNDLHNAGRQIVVACDRPPQAVSLLEDRLRSRFEWGLIADIQPPPLETRLAILHSKAEAQGLQLAPEVATYIAHCATRSVRELEGYLTRVIALAHFLGKEITLELAANALATVALKPQQVTLTPKEAIEKIAGYYHITPEMLCSRGSDRKTSHPQRMTMYLLSVVLHFPLAEIATLLGAWHKRTITNAAKNMAKALQQDPALQTERQILLHLLLPNN